MALTDNDVVADPGRDGSLNLTEMGNKQGWIRDKCGGVKLGNWE